MNVFIEFLIISLAYVLLVVTLGNYVAGVLSGAKVNGFNFKLALIGVWEMVQLAIIYMMVAWFIFTIKDIKIEEIALFPIAFKTLTVLIVVYKGNSLLLNLVTFSKIPMPYFMTVFDERVKAIFEANQLDADIDGLEGTL